MFAGALIGRKCVFGQNTMVAEGVVIGDNVKVQNNVAIYTGTTIEDDVFLGPSCVLTNVTNPRSQVIRHRGRWRGGRRSFAVAFRMVPEKPIVGWGPGRNYRELGRRLSVERRDTHNLVPWILTQVGLLGEIPYFTGVALALRGAWTAGADRDGVVPPAMLTCILVGAMSMLPSKQYCLTLALGIASGGTRIRRTPRGKERSRPTAQPPFPVVAS